MTIKFIYEMTIIATVLSIYISLLATCLKSSGSSFSKLVPVRVKSNNRSGGYYPGR